MSKHPQDQVHDILGIGFGPSNLALAIASVESAAAGTPVDAVFLERQERFGWHSGMLIDDATMQVSFLKDLVTMRDPNSDFSFVSYLHARGRLPDFINHKTLFPLRVEFHDYLAWAAGRVDEHVVYGAEVVGVEAVRGDDGVVTAYDVVTREGSATGPRSSVVRRARNIVLATGLTPRLPDGVQLGDRVWHTSSLLHRLDDLAATDPERVIVIGSGQSAAEAVAHLHREMPRTEVCAVFSRYGYSPADDSPFANRIFDPAAVDDFYFADDEVKNRLLDYHRSTNYSVVDMGLIEDLYARVYREKVLGQHRLRILGASEVTETFPHSAGVDVHVRSMLTGKTRVLAADTIVFATGYDAAEPLDLLGADAAGDVELRPDGRPEVSRDYRICFAAPRYAGLYAQGSTEYAHGLSSTLLSTTAVRAGEVLQSVVERRSRVLDDVLADAAARHR